ncbi:MAG: hypothetical protein EOP61_41465, partial [Sphingomonadales bacterium]
MSNPLAILQGAYRDPLEYARQLAAAGQRVVGYTAPDTPIELLIAAGLHPVLILPRAPVEPALTGDYLADTDPWELKAMIERLVDGSCRDLAIVIVSRPHEWLYYMGKEFVRTGMGEAIPPLHMLDLVHHADASIAAYNR